jgi:uncharacterized membrane protein YcaP (DUF421 family)
MDIIYNIFGQGKDLTAFQMSARAVVIYLITLILIRISGRRTFGKKSAFDTTIVIILGSVMSRAVVGASAFVPTVVCCLAFVLLHRGIAWLRIYSKFVTRLTQGAPRILYKDGKIHRENLRVGLMTDDDLHADVRRKANISDLKEVKEIHLESTGEISVIK